MAGCGRAAILQPRISFTALGHPHRPRATIKIGILFCREHATQERRDLLTEESWQVIEQVLEGLGRAPPDRSSAILEFDPVS